MIEMYIEGQAVDINVGFSTLLNFVIDDIKDFGAKNTSFSKTIILPGSKRNNTLFGNIFNINRSTQNTPTLPNYGYNYNAAASARAVIFSDSMQVFKGVLRLMEIIIDNNVVEYEVAVFGELGGFVSKLGNLKLKDLDFSAYNHIYSLANITGSWTNAVNNTGIYYPLIDYGGYSTGVFGTAKKDYQYRTFRPALHVKEYIDKIITGAGYTYESAFLDTNFFKSLIIPNNQKALYIPKNKVFYTTANPIYDNSGNLGGSSYDNESDVIFPGFVGGLFTTTNNQVFTYTGTPGSFSFNIRLNGSVTLSPVFQSGNLLTLKVTIWKNGALFYDNGALFGINTNGTLPFVFNENVQITFATGDTFQVHTRQAVRHAGSPSLYYRAQINGVSLDIDTPVPVLSPAEFGDTVRMNEILPVNIFQKDFFSSILKMFCLLVTEDKFNPKHLIITPYIDFFDTNTANAIDWTNKIDRSKPISVKPMSELNARYYEFNYKPDTDFYNDEYKKKYNEGYGDRTYDNGFEFAKEKESIEVIFSATVLAGYYGEQKVVSTIFKRNNNLEDRSEHNIRILQAKNITGITSWNILDGNTVLSSQTNYPYAGHLDDPDVPTIDLSFGIPKELYFVLLRGNLARNLFNVFYSPYFAEITDVDSKLLKATARLKRQDINNLDFSKFIWIDGGLFRLNKIEDYNATEEDTCKVELLKVINQSY